MARIRTVKPSFFKHAELYDAEVETGMPLRVAFAGLWTVADRDGRFKWKPRDIKTEVLPHDALDFSRVLDALTTRGFVERYEVDGEGYGWIPTFKDHQSINNKESKSVLPPPPVSRKRKLNKINDHSDASGTRTLYSEDATTSRGQRDRHATSGEGKGSLTTLPPIPPGDTPGSGSLVAHHDRSPLSPKPEQSNEHGTELADGRVCVHHPEHRPGEKPQRILWIADSGIVDEVSLERDLPSISWTREQALSLRTAALSSSAQIRAGAAPPQTGTLRIPNVPLEVVVIVGQTAKPAEPTSAPAQTYDPEAERPVFMRAQHRPDLEKVSA